MIEKKTLEGITISKELYAFIGELCKGKKADIMVANLADLVREFRDENENLLKERDKIQSEVDRFFHEKKKKGKIPTGDVIARLSEIGYISEKSDASIKISTEVAEEIYPMAGPQLVVPADKANMVLNAANARWGSLYEALYSSNIIRSEEKKAREEEVRIYAYGFLDQIIKFENGSTFHDVKSFSFDHDARELVVHTENGETRLTVESNIKFIGANFYREESPSELLLKNNGLMVEIKLDDDGVITDVLLESALTYIIDLEDASISAPENKYESYRILKGIIDGGLECEVRGEIRKINKDTTYFEPRTKEEKTLKRTSLALVRDVGPHMVADENIITVDGKPVPEKILDIFMTSLIGYRYHVAPKMHGAKEVEFNTRLLSRINQLQGLPENANKVGVMNEEIRTNAQLKDAILAAKDNLFFTNTGFLDYTGSFIDLMMHQGAIAPYRDLSRQLYKTSYEENNVNISLPLGVPQIGAGMWPKINDMLGLLTSKQEQIKGLTDTGWSPFPKAAVIHVLVFHIVGNVRNMQKEYLQNPKTASIEEMFTFPAADLDKLTKQEIEENMDFAVHGLLAYAEPWVRRGIGCSGVKELSGEPLMEDRATARIKAAFLRNWLHNGVVSEIQIYDSITRMARIVDKQNEDTDGYKPLFNKDIATNKAEEVVIAVRELILNPLKLKQSYVEPYFYPANRRQNKNSKI